MSRRTPGQGPSGSRRGAPRTAALCAALLLFGSTHTSRAAHPVTPEDAMAPAPARPALPAKGSGADVEDVEPVEDVMVVSPAQGTGHGAHDPGAHDHGAHDVVGAGRGKPGFWRGLARLHTAFVHFPIAWLVLLLLIDIRTVAWRRPGWERLGLIVLALTVAAMVPAVVTGLLRADQLQKAPDTARLVLAHRNIALLTGGVTLAALCLRLARRNRLEGPYRFLYLGLLGAAAGLVLLTGHRGAAVAFGADFLPF